MSLPNSPDDAELVPELSTWSQQLGEEIRLEEWIGVVGDPKLAIGYLRVFWPPFVARFSFQGVHG
jgi:hypothetical protein